MNFRIRLFFVFSFLLYPTYQNASAGEVSENNFNRINPDNDELDRIENYLESLEVDDPELYRSLELHVLLYNHSLACASNSCSSENCAKMKQYISLVRINPQPTDENSIKVKARLLKIKKFHWYFLQRRPVFFSPR